MNGARTVSQRAWLALVVSFCVAAASWFAWFQLRPQVAAVDREPAALAAERDSLRGNEDVVRDGLRQQRETLRKQAWTAGSLAALRAALGDRWQWRWETKDRATLVRVAPRNEEWPAYLALIESLGGKPGLVIDSFEGRAEGTAQHRRLTDLNLGLRFIVSDAPIGDAERAAPNRGPLPVAPADGPAVAQKVGPATPLHRPAASAEPPTGGPASASFRPHPLGPSAGISTKTINQQDISR